MPIHTPVFDANGVITLRSAEVIENMIADLKSKPAWGVATQAESDDALAQLLAPTGDAIGQCYELVQNLWDAWDPDAAEGTFQDNLYWILGLTREPSTRSIGDIEIAGGDPGGTVPAGLRCRVPAGPFFITQSPTALDGSGDGAARVESEELGQVQATAGTLTEKVTADPSWNSATITNPADVELGQLVETPKDFRDRRAQSLSRAGFGTDQSMKAGLEALGIVTAAVVISNRELPTVDGVPGKAFEAVIHPDPGVNVDEIGEVLWRHLPTGIKSHGDVTLQVVDDQGETQLVRYSLADPLDIYWEIDVTTKSGYPGDGDDQVKAAVLAFGNSLSVGDDIEPTGAIDTIKLPGDDGVPGVYHLVVRVKAGSAPGPTDTVPVAITQREIGDHDLLRITVVSV